MRSSIVVLGILLLRPPHLAAQTEAETQRATLTGLRSFGVHASVQLSQGASLESIDERVLRARVEDALRREGIVIQSPSGVQDGSQASLDLLYVVMQTKDTAGRALGFAASSCLQASQMVRIPRLTTPKHIAYAVVSTWRSCGLLVGDSASFRATMVQNADQQLARFLEAWRRVNLPLPPPASPGSPEARVSMELGFDQ